MKLRLTTRTLPGRPNPYRTVPCNTLHIRYLYSLLIRRPHLPRRQLRLTHSKPPRQRCLFLLYLPLPPHRTRPLLWLLSVQRDMKHWGCTFPPGNDNCLCWLCPPLRTNVILGGHRHYKPPVRRTLRGQYPSSMDLGWIFSR